MAEEDFPNRGEIRFLGDSVGPRRGVYAAAARWTSIPVENGSLALNINNSFVAIDSIRPSVIASQIGELPACILSDYGGDHPKSSYRTMSYLVSDFGSIVGWMDVVERSRFDTRRMSYKSLRDSVRLQRLRPFLTACDGINGCLVTFAIHNSLLAKLSAEVIKDLQREVTNSGHAWDGRLLSRAVRTIFFAALLCAGLLRQKESVFWVSDFDEFADTRKKGDAALQLFRDSHRKLAGGDLERFHLDVIPGAAQRDAAEALSIPDLAAGTLAAVLSKHPVSNLNYADFLRLPLTADLKYKDRTLMNWLFDSKTRLRKIHAIMRPLSTADRGGRSYKLVVIPGCGEGTLLDSRCDLDVAWAGLR